MPVRVVEPRVEVVACPDGHEALRLIEAAGRTCWKSEGRTTEGSHERFVSNLLAKEHESVIEHVSATVRIVCDRGVSHELVRHRLASYSQESTRYVGYDRNGFEVVRPCYWPEDSDLYWQWKGAMQAAEAVYGLLRRQGATPQEARAVLPHSMKTEIVMTANLREWRHFLRLRTARSAHPQMRQIAGMIGEELSRRIPILFDEWRSHG